MNEQIYKAHVFGRNLITMTSKADRFGVLYTIIVQAASSKDYFTPYEYRNITPQKASSLIRKMTGKTLTQYRYL